MVFEISKFNCICHSGFVLLNKTHNSILNARFFQNEICRRFIDTNTRFTNHNQSKRSYEIFLVNAACEVKASKISSMTKNCKMVVVLKRDVPHVCVFVL